MSADNWAKCPRCMREAAEALRVRKGFLHTQENVFA